jgi:hypothetical protein
LQALLQSRPTLFSISGSILDATRFNGPSRKTTIVSITDENHEILKPIVTFKILFKKFDVLFTDCLTTIDCLAIPLLRRNCQTAGDRTTTQVVTAIVPEQLHSVPPE